MSDAAEELLLTGSFEFRHTRKRFGDGFEYITVPHTMDFQALRRRREAGMKNPRYAQVHNVFTRWLEGPLLEQAVAKVTPRITDSVRRQAKAKIQVGEWAEIIATNG